MWSAYSTSPSQIIRRSPYLAKDFIIIREYYLDDTLVHTESIDVCSIGSSVSSPGMMLFGIKTDDPEMPVIQIEPDLESLTGNDFRNIYNVSPLITSKIILSEDAKKYIINRFFKNRTYLLVKGE